MKYLYGIDGCKKGWVAIIKEIESGNISWQLLHDLKEIIDNIDEICVVAIDIPIGLTKSGPRECDVMARRILGTKKRKGVLGSGFQFLTIFDLPR